MKNLIAVTFEPTGRKINVRPGISLLEAAHKAGVTIRSECSGKGACGKCRVIVRDKSAVTEITGDEDKHLLLGEIDLGYRLACRTILKKSTKVMIPEESRILARKIQVSGLEIPLQLKPYVKKIRLKLAKPTLLDARPDLERLIDHVKNAYGFAELEIGYEALKELPDILRQAEWDVTAVLLGDREIISVEEGDTSDKVFGLAVDIGTSKIVGCLVNLATGKTLSTSFVENPQITHGEDVVSRITFSANDADKLQTLQKLLVEGTNSVLSYTCAQVGVHPQNVYEVTAVGNTAMHHFFLGINPKYAAISPFTPALKRSINVKARELGINICPEGNVHVPPVIAGFVGADAVADLLANCVHESEELSLLLDIGTNTEIFVGNSEDILSCSCASGPAFEGGQIKHGIRAVTGAIEKVSITSDYKVKYKTIDNEGPRGLCGSAMIDVLAELFKLGVINERARFNANIRTPRLRRANDGLEFVLVWKEESGTGLDITITQKDINEIQLAKAAIFAGCSILMDKKNVELEEIDGLLVAGSFGSYINPENAKLIGLVPDVPTEKIRFVGNTALSGAKMLLISEDARKTADELSRKVRYIELASEPEFNNEFADATFIPHKDINRFPSVKKALGC
ncbi:MAG: ASKHA domain-containing protein [Candidatus Bathyarchaeia archaeon]|jgi:uncharacterized 2Fe-2S/4Fe-4S cluster protein (DUF4445 family)